MAMIFICIMGGITTFAYEPPSIIGGTSNDYFTFDREYVEENTNLIPWNQYFTDGTGAIYRILEQDDTEHGICNHKYIQDTLGIHSRTDNGCSITEHDAIRCSLCAYIFKKEETRGSVMKPVHETILGFHKNCRWETGGKWRSPQRSFGKSFRGRTGTVPATTGAGRHWG